MITTLPPYPELQAEFVLSFESSCEIGNMCRASGGIGSLLCPAPSVSAQHDGKSRRRSNLCGMNICIAEKFKARHGTQQGSTQGVYLLYLHSFEANSPSSTATFFTLVGTVGESALQLPPVSRQAEADCADWTRSSTLFLDIQRCCSSCFSKRLQCSQVSTSNCTSLLLLLLLGSVCWPPPCCCCRCLAAAATCL
jgi:hypothetical protein